MRTFLSTIFIVFFIPLVALCSNPWQPSGARQAGLGGASVGIADLWSAANNQAGMAFYQHPAVGIYYTNAYFLEDLSTKSIAGTIPFKNGAFGVTATYFGYSYYNEINAGLSYAQRFGDYIAAAVQVDFLHLGQSYDKLESKSTATFELALMGKINKNLMIGAHVYNPINVKYSEYATIPACYRLGIGWFPVKEVLTSIEMEMQTGEKVNAKCGVEYSPIKIIGIRVGYASLPQIWDFGVGLHFSDFTIDLTPTWNNMLGFSTHVAVSYQFSKHKK